VLIQRQVSEKQPPEPNRPADQASQEGGEEVEIDLDELARQVWAQLKRRLRVEQERVGR
jgi:hypothetical protein